MPVRYRVLINGVKSGADPDEVAANAARLFNVPVEKVRPLLDGGGVTIKGGLELPAATKYQAALDAAGCNAALEPESTSTVATPEVGGAAARTRQPDKPVTLTTTNAISPLAGSTPPGSADTRANGQAPRPSAAKNSRKALLLVGCVIVGLLAIFFAVPRGHDREAGQEGPLQVAGKAFTCELEVNGDPVLDFYLHSNDGRFIVQVNMVRPDQTLDPIVRGYGTYQNGPKGITYTVTAQQGPVDEGVVLDQAPITKTGLPVTSFENETGSLADGRQTLRRTATVRKGKTEHPKPDAPTCLYNSAFTEQLQATFANVQREVFKVSDQAADAAADPARAAARPTEPMREQAVAQARAAPSPRTPEPIRPVQVAGKVFSCESADGSRTSSHVLWYSKDGRFIWRINFVLPNGTLHPLFLTYGAYESTPQGIAHTVTAQQGPAANVSLNDMPLKKVGLSPPTHFVDELGELPDGRHTRMRIENDGVSKPRPAATDKYQYDQICTTLDSEFTRRIDELFSRFSRLTPSPFEAAETRAGAAQVPPRGGPQAGPSTRPAAQGATAMSPEDRTLFAKYPNLAMIHAARLKAEANQNPMCGVVAAQAKMLEESARSYALAAQGANNPATLGATYNLIERQKERLLDLAAKRPSCFGLS